MPGNFSVKIASRTKSEVIKKSYTTYFHYFTPLNRKSGQKTTFYIIRTFIPYLIQENLYSNSGILVLSAILFRRAGKAST